MQSSAAPARQRQPLGLVERAPRRLAIGLFRHLLLVLLLVVVVGDLHHPEGLKAAATSQNGSVAASLAPTAKPPNYL